MPLVAASTAATAAALFFFSLSFKSVGQGEMKSERFVVSSSLWLLSRLLVGSKPPLKASLSTVFFL